MGDLAGDLLVFAASVGAVVAIGLALLLVIRRRAARRNQELSAVGGGAWQGRLIPNGWEQLWGDAIPWWIGWMYDAGYPCLILAEDRGLTVAPRGGFLERLPRIQAETIPWDQVAGVDSRPLGFEGAGGRLSLLPLTEVTVYLLAAQRLPAGAPALDSDELDDLEDLGCPRGTLPLQFTTTGPEEMTEVIGHRGHGRAL